MPNKRIVRTAKRIFVVLCVGFLLLTAALQLALKIGGAGLTVLDVYSQSFPKTDRIVADCPDAYLLKTKSYFEKQGRSQCGGYASAYLLRCLGEDVTGQDSYERLGHKLSNGYVLPQALIQAFQSRGHRARLYRGSIEQLKTRLSEGQPMIVLIGEGLRWQHYVTVVGYDAQSILLYDSNKDEDNSKGYNRKMSVSEFISQWENGIPLFERLYFVVE